MGLENLPEQKNFPEREIIPLKNGGEVEVVVKQEADRVFSFLINVRSQEEKGERNLLGEIAYYEKLNNGELPITGDGSPEGLLVAYHYLENLLERLREGGAQELWVDGDDRRIEIYRKVLPGLGFEETMREGGGPAFVYRY